ncbi:ArsR/SmtB family transcription factor [Paenibacillus jilunlii]|uniref:ArsR family transcriptional regulator n=1 Tax=Paenibacillus jilunlii TaxID=682956 RepID=A0A1G9VZE7_9BACL|nr:winged helix-turn-helix domain-containing protein [Paenibacillus jilunlii]KWX76075.1 ArsR family transcriptional regulator [Paenibacillus jilunlii]SDM77672.1 DNA-binding transcriptional regulator, ArsR family [Paenibacillus jilunlii]
MQANPAVAQVASLITEPSRASILTVLMDGGLHPATALAAAAGIKPQTASFHLGKMAEGGILTVHTQGRHRYYGISSPEIAQVIELLLSISPPVKVSSLRHSVQDQAMRHARTCYDHLAGKFGVQLTEALLLKGIIAEEADGFAVTVQGEHALNRLGIDLDQVRKCRRAFAPKCLDWSERRYHLAGALGAAILQLLLDRQWVNRLPHTRAVVITAEGQKGLAAAFPLTFSVPV